MGTNLMFIASAIAAAVAIGVTVTVADVGVGVGVCGISGTWQPHTCDQSESTYSMNWTVRKSNE